MRRVASVFLPQLPIERLQRERRPRARPEAAHRVEPPVDDDPGACSVPRGGGWRPGARWAQEGAVAPHRVPPHRELGRRSEAADHPFRAMRPDEGGFVDPPQAPSVATAAFPVVLAARSGQREIVHALNADAAALGLTVGMAVAQARALVSELTILPADPDADIAFLRRLAEHAVGHWTPTAAVDAPAGLLLDLTGTTHLFGGEERFCRRLCAFLARIGLTAQLAIADTPGAAHAVARHGRATITIVPPGRSVDAIAPLPIASLRLEEGALTAARRFGLERVADLLPLPRAPLARRLGAAAIARLDQAIGRVAEPITGVDVFLPPTAERRLLEPIGTPEAIGQVISDVTADLCETLRTLGLGARGIAMSFLRVDGTKQTIRVGLARASRDAGHIARLFRLRLDTVDPGMGIEAALVRVHRAEPLTAEALRSPLVNLSAPSDVAPLVDQLVGRVGERALFKTRMVESDVPERAVARVSALAPVEGWPTWRRPARLLARPEPLHSVVALLPDHPPRRFGWRGAMHDVVAGDGPERIHGEWWVRDGEVWAVRDYFRVEDADGARFWVFRRGDGVDGASGDLSWWMHGAFG